MNLVLVVDPDHVAVTRVTHEVERVPVVAVDREAAVVIEGGGHLVTGTLGFFVYLYSRLYRTYFGDFFLKIHPVLELILISHMKIKQLKNVPGIPKTLKTYKALISLFYKNPQKSSRSSYSSRYTRSYTRSRSR